MKNFLKRSKQNNNDSAVSSPARITNETVAEHREQVLAGGRKFKYPVQYQKHRLVITSVVIGVSAIVLVTIFGWYQLYIAQDSSRLLYQVTQIVPVSVASVDGEPVRYRDYLLRYRSSLYYLQQQNQINLRSDDGKRQAEYMKRVELNKAEEQAYVAKLARQRDIKVDSEEIDAFIKKDIDARSVSLNAYEKTVLNSFYGWSLDEYKSVVRAELLKRKVSLAIDEKAKTKIDQLYAQVNGGADIATIARDHSDDTTTKAASGDSGPMPVDGQDSNGLIATASKLEKGQLSAIIEGVDGYYFLKLIDKDASSVRYTVVKVALSALREQFDQLRKDNKINEYIKVEQLNNLDQ